MTPGMNEPIWGGDHDPETRPALAGEQTADVCVVGLGGSGLTAIHALLDAGASVVGIDAGPTGGGAAGRNGGLLLAGLAPFHHDAAESLGPARAAALYRETLREIDRIEAQTPGAVRRTGSLRLAIDAQEKDDCRRQRDAMRRDGLPVEPYAGIEGEGLFFPHDACFDPLLRCRTLAAHAEERGARLFEGTPATGITGSHVTTPAGSIEVKTVIVAVDGHLDRLLPELSGRVRTARLQMLGTAPDPGIRLPRPIYLRNGYEYVQQLPDGRIALGGFRDHFEQDEWTHDAVPTSDIQDLLERFLRESLDCTAEVTHRWAASVGYTTDGVLPVVEEVRPGVLVAGGYSGTGNVVGALAGRALAALATRTPSPLIDLFQDPR